ncbi:facilitated trehalose transporter Tret1 isoform X1 [Anastrepha obliqua]|uniref:facilitated trehalose transporter Tret1 isoform X1 n=1 Tax=Anastrepha obliqua TaxID=95512 RepID=UPI002409262B|nr:facilitated trehalose transporter Tret1 isoform X1 [Anastrepha obliqua]
MVDSNASKYQYLAGICVNIITISYGGFSGWPAASFLELQSEDTPLESGPISNSDIGWVGCMVCVGGALGTMFFSWFADRYGRKKCLLLVALPSLAGWLIIPFATTPTHLCIARVFGGIAGGGIFTVIPIYTTELAQDHVRGILGTVLMLAFNFGMLSAFVLGNFFSYSMVAWILSSLTFVFLMCFSFLPETPQHLINNNKIKKAEKSLKYFRNIRALSHELPEHFKFELDKLKGEGKQDDDDNDNSNSLTWKDINTPSTRKAFMIGLGIITLMQFSGCFAMLNYSGSIFKESGSSLSPTISTIIVGFIQLVGSYMSTLLVERAGRKVLLLISTSGIALSHIIFATYTYLNVLGYDVSAFSWVPVASFSFTIFIASCGLMGLPYLVIAEIMPPKLRSMGSMACMMHMWFTGIFMLKYLPVMAELLGMHGMVFAFAGICIVGLIFLIIFVPETKGRTIDDILASL